MPTINKVKRAAEDAYDVVAAEDLKVSGRTLRQVLTDMRTLKALTRSPTLLTILANELTKP